MLSPSSARLFLGPALTEMPDAHSITFYPTSAAVFFVLVFSYFDPPQHTTRSYLPRAFGQPFMDKGASRWYIFTKSAGERYPVTGNHLSLSLSLSLSLARTLGKEGRKAMS
jgi:hypothetical protein